MKNDAELIDAALASTIVLIKSQISTGINDNPMTNDEVLHTLEYLDTEIGEIAVGQHKVIMLMLFHRFGFDPVRWLAYLNQILDAKE